MAKQRGHDDVVMTGWICVVHATHYIVPFQDSKYILLYSTGLGGLGGVINPHGRLDRTSFAWHGYTSRAEYRHWLLLIIAVDAILLIGLAPFARRGTVHFDDFGWPGILLFAILIAYSIGWLFLTARRLRSANISRAWLIFTVLGLTFHIGGTYVSGSAVASLLLTGVGATVRDRSEVAVG